MALYVYSSFFDLPSLDPSSLQFLAVARFCAADVKIITVENASSTPSGLVPCFDDGNVVISDFENFVDYMRNAHREIVLDYELTDEQRTLSIAYSALINDKLVPALDHLFWVDHFNYDSLTRPAYLNILRFPYYLMFLHNKRNEVRKRLDALNKKTKEMMKDAINVLNALSDKLGESKYLNGTKPSSLDAFLFGHLAPLLKLPLANDTLKHHLESQPNLCLYLENISSIYLPLNEEQLRESIRNRTEFMPNVDNARKALETQRTNERIKKADKEKADKDSTKNVLIFGIVTIALSAVFAFHFGVIKVSSREVV